MFSNALKSFQSNIGSKYSLGAQPTSTSGPWHIYDATHKKTGQPYSVFVFDRKTLSPSGDNGLSLRGSSSRDGLRAAQDEVVERLKREANFLARLRHPQVLELVEPVEDTRSGGLQFATEPVACSLGTLLAEKADAGRGRARRRDVELDELEMQKGLEQVAKGLEFLHESANLIHGNLTPEAVMVNAKSDWKICALGFAVSSVKPPLPAEFDPRLPPFVQHALDYAAPDLVLDQTPTPSCDMFSLGLLIVALYSAPHRSPLETHNSNATYRRLLASPSTTPTPANGFLAQTPLPRPVTESLLPQLITRRPAGRLSAREFQQSAYFDNILVSTLRFLDSLPAKTPSEKQAFMRGLPKVLPQFPRTVLEKKILPGLVEELRDASTLALVLPNIFAIVEPGTARLFSEKVLGKLREVFATTAAAPSSEPKTAAAKVAEREREAGREGGLTVILAKLPVIKDKTTAREFKEDLLPLLFAALDSPTHSLQDLALRSLPTILPKLDFPTLKNDLFPVVAGVFTKTASLGIKIRGLEAFRVLCGGIVTESDGLDGGKTKGDAPVLDKYTIQEKVIPLLKGIKTKEPAVMMEALAVFEEIGRVCDREVVAMEILPTLWTMSFGPLLGLEQFKSFMTTIRALSSKIEMEQIRKLSELTSGPEMTAGEFLSFGGAPGAAARSTSPAADTSFEALVFGANKKSAAAAAAAAAAADGFDWSRSTPLQDQRAESPHPGRRVALSPANTAAAAAAKPKFNWSTPSPTNRVVPSSSVGGNANMGATPALQPAPAAAGFGSTTAMRPLQPVRAPTTTTPALQPMQPMQPQRPASTGASASSSTTTAGGGGGIDWTAATKKPNFPSNPTPQQQTTILYGQTRAAPPPATSTAAADFSGFGLPPPPPGGNASAGRGMGMGGAAAGGAGALAGLNFGSSSSSSSGGGIGMGMGMGMNGGGMNMGMGMGRGVGMNGSGMGGMGMGMGMGATNSGSGGGLPPPPGATPKPAAQGLDKWESLL